MISSRNGARPQSCVKPSNRATAPYQFKVTPRKGRYVLEGRVGTSEVHDAAVPHNHGDGTGKSAFVDRALHHGIEASKPLAREAHGLRR